MQIRKLQEGDFKKLVPIYKKFFPVHIVFTKSDEEIIKQLAREDSKI